MLPNLFDARPAMPVFAATSPHRLPARHARLQLRHWRPVGAMALLTAGLLLGGPSQAQVGSTSQAGTRTVNEWLSRMHEASRQRAYTGTLVVSAGATMSASKI